MGNRYGRNQKRKAKAALVEAAAREEGLRRLWNRAKSEIDIEARERRHLEQQIRDVQEILGRAFIAFDPATGAHGAQWLPYLNLRPMYPLTECASAGDVCRNVQQQIHTLQGVRFDALREHLRRLVHYSVSFQDCKVGYYLSDEAVLDRCVPLRVLEEQAFRELAHAFTGELEKLRNGK